MRRPTAIVLLVLLIISLLISESPHAQAQDGAGPPVHIVQAGDNLYRIALRYGVTIEALMAANGLTTTSVIVPGQTLAIPDAMAPVPAFAATIPAGARTHRVAEGESLLQIARRYNVTLDALARANNITHAALIVPGQVLIIPTGGGTADLGLVGVTVPVQPVKPPAADLGILPAGASAAPAAPQTAPQMPAYTQVVPASATPVEATAQATPSVTPEPLPSATHTPVASPEETAPAATATGTPTATALAPVVSGSFDAGLVAPDLGILSPSPEAEPPQDVTASPEATVLATPEGAASLAEQPAGVPAEAEESAAIAPAPAGETLSAAEQPAAAPAESAESAALVPITVDETLSAPDLGIIAPDTAAWVRQPGLFTTGGARVREIFERGQARGNNAHAFSKVGDCNSELPFFLGRFDSGDYDLGPYAYLQPAIDYFAGSFGRQSMAVWTGSHAWSVLDPTWANPALCLPGETPLGCEFRLHRPSVVLIRLGTNEAYSPALFEQHLRAIIEYSIEQGVIPLLGTKADQLEGSDHINDIVRQLAAEYEVPLWDFGRVASTVPGRGLREDGFHMTWYPLTYGDPRALQAGHSVHNLAALIALHTVWQSAMASVG
ncbi:MAG: LysM peptidoglycan-binding domain-containing protein [Anaerolineae bacterium]|nr:LysM peptidoglycan-binding domain-containing protein [Anaerolineae bacterium]